MTPITGRGDKVEGFPFGLEGVVRLGVSAATNRPATRQQGKIQSVDAIGQGPSHEELLVAVGGSNSASRVWLASATPEMGRQRRPAVHNL